MAATELQALESLPNANVSKHLSTNTGCYRALRWRHDGRLMLAAALHHGLPFASLLQCVAARLTIAVIMAVV